MSKLIIDDEDCSGIIPSLSFNCGICGGKNTFIEFVWGDGNGGQVIFACYDCKASYMPTHYNEWIKHNE